MTEKLYLQSDSLTMHSTVLTCEPAGNEQYHICLAATLFHPQGGGQPFDSGTIGDAKVLNVIAEGERIIHVTDRPVEPGFLLTAVDKERRLLNTRMHSAGHLIAVVVEGMGWRAVKASHRPGEGRVVFEPVENSAEPPVAGAVAEGVGRLISEGLPRHQSLEEGIRRVTWGMLPGYACGGTHVISTDLIGETLIQAVKFRKGNLSVSYDLT